MPIKGGVFSGENFKIFQNFTKNLKTIQNTKIVSKLYKRVVSGGGWWVVGHTWIVFFFIHSILCIYTYYIR